MPLLKMPAFYNPLIFKINFLEPSKNVLKFHSEEKNLSKGALQQDIFYPDTSTTGRKHDYSQYCSQ